MECENIVLVELGILDFGIRNTAQGIRYPLTIKIQNPSFTNKDLNTVPGIRNPLHGIQTPKLSWMGPLHGVACVAGARK